MRHETNRERVERLMAGLGRAAREPGRIYFTGGVTAVQLRLKRADDREALIVRFFNPGSEPVQVKVTKGDTAVTSLALLWRGGVAPT